MSSRRRTRPIPSKARRASSPAQPAAGQGGDPTGAETVTAADRPVGSRSANRAAKRVANPRPRPVQRSRRNSNSTLGIAVLAIGAVAIAIGVLLFGNPFGAPSPSASAAATASDQVGDGTCPTQQPAALPAGEIRSVTITTPKGNIEIEVDANLGPIAAGNFVALIQCHFYDGSVFHRTASQDGTATGTPFVIQGGAAKPGTAEIPYTIQDDPVTADYKRGVVAMANTGSANTGTSQFFIVLNDSSFLSKTYSVFGTVVGGMDVADQIYAASKGVESPTNPIPMTSVTVSAAPAATASVAPTVAASAVPSSATSPAASTAP